MQTKEISSFLARSAQFLRKLGSTLLRGQLSALLSEQSLSSRFHGHLLFPLHPPLPHQVTPLAAAIHSTSR